MAKFEDIPKKEYLGAPEGYFDSLPGRISARIERTKPSRSAPAFRYALRLSIAFIILVAVGITWFIPTNTTDAESLLASVETEVLINYLVETDHLSNEDFLEEMNLSTEEADALEGAVFELQWQDENPDALLEELENYNL